MRESNRNKSIRIAKSKGYYYDLDGNIYSASNKKLKLFRRNHYLHFGVRVDSHFRKRRVISVPAHRFIAFCKYGDIVLRDREIEVRHLDGNSVNNAPKNLDLGTRSENSYDRPKTERVAMAKYASSFLRKFSDQEEKDMTAYYKMCHSYKKTMEFFNVKKSTLHYILHKPN